MGCCTMRRSVFSAARDVTGWARAAVAVDQAHEALGHRTFEADGAVFIRNPALPDIHVANYCRSVTAATPDAVDRLLARADREFRDCPHRCFAVDPDPPPAFEERLVREGHAPREVGPLGLEDEVRRPAKPLDLELTASEAG